MAQKPTTPSLADNGSPVLLDEYFAAEDARFLEHLRTVAEPKKLAALAERWKKDPRPWARARLLEYLEAPLDRNGHQPLVKRLFKHADAQHDDALMAAFAVAFDRLARRRRRKNWSWASGTMTSIEVLRAPLNALVFVPGRKYAVLDKESHRYVKTYQKPGFRLFKHRTRYYLRRRAWRHFRRAAFRRPADYPALAAAMLKLYRDEDVATGENLLDCWSLLHACFRRSPALAFHATHVEPLADLTALAAAPAFEKRWADPAALPVLLDLVLNARARIVRVWSIQMLRRLHAAGLKGMPLDTLRRLIDHEDEELQQFGAELLPNAAGLQTLTVEQWMGLLKTQNLTVLQVICDCFVRHVRPERLDLAQCIELACERAAPIARLGLTMLKERRIETPEDREAISAVANGKSSAVAGELAAWALGIVGSPTYYERGNVVRFFDCPRDEARAQALKWLRLPEGASGAADPGLFARLIETPYDDIRLALVEELERRTGPLASASTDVLAPLWASVLLSIHRGGRQKSAAVRQIGEALRDDPSRAAKLLPVLSVALRSVRPAEARAGLAAVIGALEARPELAPIFQKHLPELRLTPEGAV